MAAWQVRLFGMVIWLGTSAGVAAGDGAGIDAVLCSTADVPALVLTETMLEARTVMRDAGVALRIELRNDGCVEPRVEAAEVIVRLQSGRAPREDHPGKRPVASIQFVDDVPGRVITLWLASAQYLLHRDAAILSVLARFPSQLAHRWTGRVLGRALAHELGHYLMRTPTHTASGLMRATHTAAAFVRPDRKLFQLSAAQRDALLARRTPPVTGGVALAR